MPNIVHSALNLLIVRCTIHVEEYVRHRGVVKNNYGVNTP